MLKEWLRNMSNDFSKSSSSILLSIKPKYCDMILQGIKTVEFRRSLPKRDIKSIVFYSTAPEQCLRGIAIDVEIVRGPLEHLWVFHGEGGGVSRSDFDSYFLGKECGAAILINGLSTFELPIDPKKIIDNFVAPQSYRYLNGDAIKQIFKHIKS